MDTRSRNPHEDLPMSQATLPGTVESIRPTFSRGRAISVASRLKPLLLKHVYRDKTGVRYCRIAGSLRRRMPDVHDVDIVAVVSTVPDDMQSPELSPRGRLRDEVKRRADEVVYWGPDRTRFVFEGVPFDLFFTRPKSFAVALLAATGSSAHLLKLNRRARLSGLRFQPTRHMLTTSEHIPIYVRAEADFYAKLDLDPVAPSDR